MICVLPEFTVVSDICRKKKDAEQSAADLALKRLAHHSVAENPSDKDPCDALIDQIKYLFSDEFPLPLHPLRGHLRAALLRRGDLYGLVRASVITACDTKTSNLCKLLNLEVELKPFLALSLIMRTIPKLSGCVASKGQLSIQKQNPYPTEIIESSDIQQSDSPESILVKAIQIPASLDKTVQPVTLNISSAGYYLDVIAEELGVTDASKVLLSRTIGKASSETRLYFAASKSLVMDLLSDLGNVKDFHVEGPPNARASYFCGQGIYGDAIMASIGYTWRSKELFHEHLSFMVLFRMLINKIPSGNYKLSREAILAAELPSVFTTEANWRGSFPREILFAFCHQHRLSEPIFSTTSVPLKASCKLLRSQKKLKVTEVAGLATEYADGGGLNAGDGESVGLESNFRCEVKVFSKGRDLIIECSPKDIYRKQTDATHSASLKVLSWLDAYFKDLGMPLEKLNCSADALDISFSLGNFHKEFALSQSISFNELFHSPAIFFFAPVCFWSLKVIKHMEENQACRFGDIALSYFRPKVLIFSTRNYEDNLILQRSSLATQEEYPDEKSQLKSHKFRNHDHKFEWTRGQFNHWASELVKKHNYSVEFSGVGGSGDVEPGFASQIAVFKQESLLDEDDLLTKQNSSQHCKVVWSRNCTDGFGSVPSLTSN
ncbi:PREDICTED: small RNA 2'-O-methyltransferase-like [Populus euphratica]|uniref:Small RNA 2'-O-methyltransferase n=1 Tax=Populus euphratica TaxID=75702 RepID=A0AAJ6Y0N5_POPEU|nr:PREDICTED: small RNA 2'-O-methyltransferase-like [Populus euphratica]